MSNARESELESNFDFFRRNLARFLQSHRGSYVLIRHANEVGFFEDVGDAYRTGLRQFPDEQFSVQRVSDEPIELGHMSFAFD